MPKTKKIIITTLIAIIILVIAYVAWEGYLKKELTKERFIPATGEKNDVIIEKTYLGYRITSPSTIPIDIIFSQASQKAGFHIHYPVFIPSGLEIDKETIWLGNSPEKIDEASFNLGDINSDIPWVAIVQKKNEPNKENSLLTKSLKDKQRIAINGNAGFIGTTEGKGMKFNHIIFKTNDESVIWLRSKNFTFDVLQKIAQSMR